MNRFFILFCTLCFSCMTFSVSLLGADLKTFYQDDTSVVGLWKDVTKTTIGETKEYTNSLELADINGDGRVDILFANGGGYEEPGDPEFSRVFLNEGPDKMFKEVTKKVLGPEPMIAARAIRVADINNDGNVDIAVGTSYQTQSQLYIGDGKGDYPEGAYLKCLFAKSA